MELYGHQRNFCDTAPNKYLMAHGTGTGKTITALAIAKKRAKSVLIICPKGIKSKWIKDAQILSVPYEIYTKEEFRKLHKSILQYDAIIIDEIHHFSSIRSQLHKSMLWYIKKQNPQFIWGLSATPYRREPFNIYALAKILGHNWDYMNFRSTFYFEKYFSARPVWLPRTDKTTQDKLVKLLLKIADVVSYENVAEMPPVNHIVEFIEQTTEQKTAIKKLELTEANPLTFYLREHQIMSGIGSKSKKDERLLELAEESPKMAIFARYTAQIDAYKHLFPEAMIIDGRTVDKSFVAKKIESADNGIILIQSDSAEGYELPSVHTAVFASMSYSYLAYVQSLGRFIRINANNKPKRFFYLITKGSIDEDVYKNIMKKQDFDLALYTKNAIL